MAENDLQLVNRDGRIVAEDPETGETRPVSLGDVDAGSVSTEEIGSTFWAAAHAGAAGGEKLQNAIDAAATEASSVGGAVTVVITGAPDDLSGYDDADRTDGWLIDATLQHKTGVHIQCFGDPYFYLDNGVDGALIENADQSNGNSNLKLIGGTWDPNPNNNTIRTEPKNGALVYNNVDEIEISPKEVRNMGSQAYAIQVGDGHDWQFGTIRFAGDKDGLHIHGPAENIDIQRLYGDAGDDMLALATADYSGNQLSEGDVKNVTVHKIGEQEGPFDEGGVSLHGNSDYVIKDVDLKTIHGGTQDTVVQTRTDSQITGDGKVCVDNLTIGTLHWEGGGESSSAVLLGGADKRNITIENAQLTDVGNVRSLVYHGDGGTINLRVNVQVDGSGSLDIIRGAGGNITSPHVSGQIAAGGDVIHESGAYFWDVLLSDLIIRGSGSNHIFNLEHNGLEATMTNCRLGSLTELYNGAGGDNTLSLSNVRLQNADRAFNVSGTLNLRLQNVILNNLSNAPFRLADGATVELDAETLQSDWTGSMFETATSTYTIQVDGSDIQVDVSNVTPRKYDRAYNTDSGETAGVGEVIYQGSSWKNMDSI